MDETIFVIILNWNGKRDTPACLESLQKSAGSSFQIVVVDNGSTDGSAQAVRAAHPEVVVLETGENLGYAGGNNVGILYAMQQGAGWIVLLNNDTEVSPQMVSALHQTMKRDPKLGIVGGCPYLFDQREVLDHLGGVWNAKRGRFDLVGNRERTVEKLFAHLPRLDYVCGCALMIRREVFEKVGLFEPRYFLFWEEADFCRRVTKAGWELGVNREAALYHKVSASFVGGKPHINYFWWRNRLLYLARNCTQKEKWRLYLFVIWPGLFKLSKLWALKGMQCTLSRMLHPKKNQSERRAKILSYRAALCGVRDYFLKRFGNGPSWLFKK